MFEQADDYTFGREDDWLDAAYEDRFDYRDDEVAYDRAEEGFDDDPSDFGFDPYAGQYLDDEGPADPYDFDYFS